MRKICLLTVLFCSLAGSVFAGFSGPIYAETSCRANINKQTGDPDNNKLTVRADAGLKSWIRFNLTGIDMNRVRAATLTVTLYEPRYDATTVDVSAVNDNCHDNDTWTDTNLTWLNAPGNDTASNTVLDPTKTTFQSTLSFPSGLQGSAFSTDVTNAILSNTDNVVQFVLHNGVGATTTVINFCTHDQSTVAWHPYLTLEYTPLGADHSSPAIGSKVTTSLSSLSWTLPEPNIPGTPVYCDVYLGTEPNRPQMTKKTLGTGVKTIAISAFGALVDNTKYYWFVDMHDSSRTPNPVPGEQWSFSTYNNTAPVIEAIANQLFWGLPQTVTLNATVTDDGLPNPPAAMTYAWTLTAGPASVVINSPNTKDTTLSITEIGDYRFRLAVSDGDMTAYAAAKVVVGTTPCDASHLNTGLPYDTADVNLDCAVDLKDFAEMAFKWMNCTEKLTNCGR
jgi:hypothetical protein